MKLDCPSAVAIARRSILLVTGLLCLHATSQNTWYVDVNAVAPGDGTQGAPYTSIQYAIERPSTLIGDTILVAPGTYVENLDNHLKGVRLIASGGPLLTELRPMIPGTATVLFQGGLIEGFTLTGNASNHLNGGALNLASAIAIRCVVRDNPGLAVYSYTATLRECTIVDNGAGIFVNFFDGVTLRNTILWPDDIRVGALGTYVDYSAGTLPPESVGVGNVFGDPGMWSIPGSHYRLRPGAPCIDAGDPNSPLDPDGTRADIGAIPFDPAFTPSPASYCTAGTTSNGCVPSISGTGTPSATASNGFMIAVSAVEGQKQGHLFYGLSGALANPWGPSSTSYLCVKAPSQRTPTQNSNGTAGECDGSMQIDWNAYVAAHPSSLGAPFSAGTQVWAQLYFRDPPAPKTTNLSNGLTFVVGP